MWNNLGEKSTRKYMYPRTTKWRFKADMRNNIEFLIFTKKAGLGFAFIYLFIFCFSSVRTEIVVMEYVGSIQQTDI